MGRNMLRVQQEHIPGPNLRVAAQVCLFVIWLNLELIYHGLTYCTLLLVTCLYFVTTCRQYQNKTALYTAIYKVVSE